ncbi:MAG TPA: hypothetical protein VEZ12_20470 [Herpetosiphonaceae bacterium]|nr:hypothetical protein [Herpetosiphonaceae bacterium]
MIDADEQIAPSSYGLAAVLESVEQTLDSVVHSIAVESQEWSAGGGLHLAGVWRATEMPVLIKLGVNPNQLYWTQQMAAAAPDLVPLLYASGDRLGDLRFGWTVMERVMGGPLGPQLNGAEFEMLLEAAVRFQYASRTIEPRHVETMDAAMLRGRLEVGVTANPPGPVDIVVERLEQDWAWVTSVCELEICHGDIHMCNALTRTHPPRHSPALLIDCQPTRQPWALDAAYPQILNSIDKQRVGYRDLVPKMSRLRAGHGMSTCAERDVAVLARITLAWFAIRLWGLTPDRHAIPDYREETEQYITKSAAHVH